MISIIRGFAGGLFSQPWFWLAAALGFMTAVGGAYVKGRMDGSDLVRVKHLQQQIAEYERALKLRDAAAAADNARAAADQKVLRDMEARNRELEAYLATLSSRSDQCLSGADVDRLRKLWGSAKDQPSAPSR